MTTTSRSNFTSHATSGASPLAVGEHGVVGADSTDGAEHRSLPTGTVAFLFTDIEGSTEAWASDPSSMGTAVARLEDLLDASSVAGIRVIEQGAGDSAVIAFERATDAAAAALRSQLAISAEDWTTPAPLRVRMALHIGEVSSGRDGTYRGTTMNRCGRLLATAHGGQVVASGSFVAVLEESDERGQAPMSEASWLDLGVHRLRSVEAPMRIWQLAHPDLETDHPPLRTPEGRGLQLPGTSSPIIGREADLARLEDLLAANRVVTVFGAGGSGKTRLAVEMARSALDAAGPLGVDDVGWVDLAKVSDVDSVDALVVSELALRHGASDLRRRVVQSLQARRALVVLDNCEHVLAGVASLVHDLIADCPDVRVLATTREPLGASDEVLLRLEPLGLPSDVDGADLLSSSAGALLVDRVRRVRGTDSLCDEDRVAAAQICRRLDGVPLALELAAARTRSMPLPVVAERLSERFTLLVGGAFAPLGRQRTLEASVAWSYELLSEAEQAALRHLSTFAGPFDLGAAAAMVSVQGTEPVDLVAALVDKSLLAEEGEGGFVRFRMLETVRFYGRDRCVQAGEATGCRERHLEWVLAEMTRCADAFQGADAAEAVRYVDRTLDDVRAAMEWAMTVGRSVDVLAVAASLGWYWVWRGLAAEGGNWLARAGATLSGAAEPVGAALSAQAGFAWHLIVTHRRQDHAEIEVVAAAAIGAAVDAGDPDIEARCRLYLATHHSFHDPVAGRAEVEAAAAMCREHGGPFWSAMADGHMAQSFMFSQRLREASAFIDSAEQTARALGHHQLHVESIARRCAVAESLGDYDGTLAAMGDLDRAIGGISLRENRAIALRSAELVRLHRGDVEGVVHRVQAAIEGYVRDEDIQFIPLLAGVLGDALSAAGRPEEAVSVLEPIWEHPGVRAARVYSVVVDRPFSTALWNAGAHERARAVAADAAEAAQLIGSDVHAATVELLVAGFDLDDGLPTAAEAPLHRALEVLAENGHRPLVCDALEELARLEVDFGRPGAAVVLLGAAARERDAQHVVLRPGRQMAYETTLQRVRDELGVDEADELFARCRELELADAVATARRGRGERGRPTFGWEALTGSEMRVAGLAAEGLSNREIAERLIVGTETVKSHLGSAFRKLGVANRVQLATLVASRPPASTDAPPT